MTDDTTSTPHEEDNTTDFGFSRVNRGDKAGMVRGVFDSVEGRYDLMLSNPPYVPLDEVLELPPEYSHEPSLGLISEDDGLAIPLQILREAPDYLSDGGVLVMEVGYSVEQLSARLAQVPLLWLEFAYGGEGVLAITRDELLRYRDQFN